MTNLQSTTLISLVILAFLPFGHHIRNAYNAQQAEMGQRPSDCEHRPSLAIAESLEIGSGWESGIDELGRYMLRRGDVSISHSYSRIHLIEESMEIPVECRERVYGAFDQARARVQEDVADSIVSALRKGE